MQRFEDAVQEGAGRPGLGDPAMLASRLAWATARVLPVAGAGISALGDPDVKVPVGASDDISAAAERLQFTAGAGPCLSAHRAGSAVAATSARLHSEWPVFASLLFERTPFLAVLSLPLEWPLVSIGAVDCYLTADSDLTSTLQDGAAVVASRISAALARELTDPRRNGDPAGEGVGTGHEVGVAGPMWLHGPAAIWRSQVPVAAGILTVALQLTLSDAVAVLRAHAFVTDRTVDQVADDLVHHRIRPEELAPGAG
ncbi:hypothetical protein [Nakamurella endophytica]|uniref:hypothetical protein n=1 Tax=Nakamurella endophytica TaxID=1748367 RepID=UPI00166600FF|nr:hypothetical protein [Nakamurella endophytica]